MTTPNNLTSSAIPTSIIIPDDWKEAQLVLTDHLVRMAYAINDREVSTYQDATLSGGSNISETVTGQLWFTPGDPNKFRNGNRTVVNFGALPNVGTLTAPHGINVTSNTVFTKISGVASIPGTKYIPLPYSHRAAEYIEVWVDGTNVNIKTDLNYSAYTQAYVVLEYIESV